MKLSWLLDRIEAYRHGALGVAFGFGAAFFGVTWTVLEASGVQGGVGVIRILTFASLALFTMIYVAFLHRQLMRLKNNQKSSFPEAREAIELAITSLDASSAKVIRSSLQRYEDRIKELQSQLRPIEFPLRPRLVEGGLSVVGSNGVVEDESPSHEVLLDSFLMDPVPVTNIEFADFLSNRDGKNWTPADHHATYGVPYFLCEFTDRLPLPDKWDHPVVWVSWYAAVAFCNWRSLKEGKEPVYTFHDPHTVSADFAKTGWRLPTEAEWERAAREGLANPPSLENLDPTIANYGKHYRGTTSVGRFKANSLGIWDLLGNVKEWCHDWYRNDSYRSTSRTNPRGAEDGTLRAYRGGSWMDEASALSVTRRGRLLPQNTNPDFGFRCVRRT